MADTDDFEKMMEMLSGLTDDQGTPQFARLSAEMPKLATRLAKFGMIGTAAIVSGLMTRPENHPAWPRLELLQHLVLTHCRGREIPTSAQIRAIINDTISNSSIAMAEDPSSDVFVTNVGGYQGNVRLFESNWNDNDYSLESCLLALTLLPEAPWKESTIRSVSAFLRCAEYIGVTSELKRNTWLEVVPRQPLLVTTKLMKDLSFRVMIPKRYFSDQAIADLVPFTLQHADLDIMLQGELGSSILNRKPLILTNDFICFALPPAASPAARQFILDRVQVAGGLGQFAKAIATVQCQDMRFHGRHGWRIRQMDADELGFQPGPDELVGRFDDGGYVHVVYLPGDLGSIVDKGLMNGETDATPTETLVEQRAAQLTARPDYRRGLLIVVFGGVGGMFKFNPKKLPDDWNMLGLRCGDFVRMAGDPETSAMRAWKLLEQEDLLRQRGVTIMNLSGFMGLYSFARKQDFSLLPREMGQGMLTLDATFEAPLRHHLRTMADAHVVPLPRVHAFTGVQRFIPSSYMSGVEPLPMYYSPNLRGGGLMAGCRETDRRVWWVEMHQGENNDYTPFAFALWDLSLCWMTRVATEVEAILPNLPLGALAIVVKAPALSDHDLSQLPVADPVVAPTVAVEGNLATISCSPEFVTSFRLPENDGDRMMVAAMVRAAFGLANTPIDEAQVAAVVAAVIPDSHARFIHARPANSIQDHIFQGFDLPHLRLIEAEDLSWAYYGLPEAAGWIGGPGIVPADQTSGVLHRTVDGLWQRIKAKLQKFNRSSTIAKALANYESIERDRSFGKTTAAATLSLYEPRDVVLTYAINREGRRSLAGLASRVLAEMAVCECPANGGLPLTGIDLDTLIADIAVLIECAGHGDSLRYGLSTDPLVVHPNGTFGFDTSVMLKLQAPYMEAHGTRQFVSAATAYAKAYEVRADEPSEPPGTELDDAFTAEFGLTIGALGAFTGEVFNRCVEAQSSQAFLKRSAVVEMLRNAGASDPGKAFSSLTLLPRTAWDEKVPQNAMPRDWYPWRYNRRLSITRRPMVQVDTAEDPLILAMPTLLGLTGRFLLEVVGGNLPNTLFDSEAMKALIGRAVDREGHAFEVQVADRLKELGYQAREVEMTEIGGTAEQGNIDVLAWRPGSTGVLIIECKRLAFARTPGEIGERLEEFSTTGGTGKKRTPIQKHIDRMDFLNGARPAVARVTGIPADKLALKSVLVTDILVPMQFSQAALGMVDVVADYSQLQDKFGT
ncbi:hypothetical protein [Ferrovibrio terrae]|uniref:hypothetical protein n=1 Tax=Ferrovibrio terrae TaxID=2594003 RepID=UPI00313792A8